MRKIITLTSCILITAALLAACSGNSASIELAQSSLNREKNPTVANEDLQTLVDGNNSFALDVYQTLHSENGNLILSPYSISLALAMTYAGATGNTESQMADVLHFTQEQTVTHSTFNALDLRLESKPLNLNKDQEPLKLNIANAVWAEKTYTFLPEFLDTIATNYGSGIHLADFVTNFNNERIGINNWVSDKTEKKINDLLTEGSVDAETRMVLVNAIYFKADWANQFDANSTNDSSFHLLDGSEISVPTMNNMLYDIPYTKADGYQAVELPYAGQTAAMDIILPYKGSFNTFESSFNKDIYDGMIKGLQNNSTVSISLPKFKFTRDFGLSDALKSLGMTDAFDANLADFSRMTGKKDLYIGNVIHKAFVAVDEKGTEAAAATAVIMETASARMPETSFVADHPFIFIIRDTVNEQILFIGRVLNPKE